jgi:hypothetical protein
MMKYLLKKFSLTTFVIFIMLLIIGLLFSSKVLAGPTSTSYQIIDYGFGAGGISTTSGTSNYLLQGTVGELEMASLSSSTYIVWPGLTYTLQPAVPPAPFFTNTSNYYNKLQLIINQGTNLSDTTYAIAITTDPAFKTTQYVQPDGTLGGASYFQVYGTTGPCTGWCGSNGTTIIGLTPGTTYYARVAAGRGFFTEGPYGPAVTASTVNPTFTYSLQTTNQANPPFTVGIGVVNGGQVTTSWQKIIATISTNSNNGGTVYINDANSGLKSTQTSHTIASVQNDLSSGGVTEGYGARGVSVSASVGSMELLSPYNLGGNNVGPVNTSKNPIADSFSAPVTSGQVNFELKAKAATTTLAATDYSDTITIVASGSF